ARYSRLLSKILPYRLLIIAASIVILGAGSWWMSQYLPQEILPAINTGQVRLFLRFPTGTNLEDNLKVTQAVEKIINSSPDTQYSFITSGGFLFGNTTIENLRFSSGNITLKPGVAIDEYIEKLNRQFINLNLVDIRLRLFPARVRGLILNNSPLGNADIDVILQGENSELLQQTGKNLVKLLDEEAKLTRFRPDSEEKEREIRILPDWQKVAEFSLNTEKIGENVQAALRGSVPTQLQRGERLVDVRVQLEQAARNNINQLAQLPILIDNNHSIRLKDIAEITEGLAPREIQRINQREIYPIIGNLVGKPLEDSEIQIKPKFSDAAAEVARILQKLDLPTGVSLLPSYAARSQQELEKSLKTLGLLAIFLVFVVMAVQYNSLIDPLVIILTVPLALAGGIFGLYITQTAIGATVLVGAILLVGIVVNNAIVMVELANQLQKQANIKRHIAIIQAASSRLRPIAMTTVTTVLGMLPLTLGGGQGSEFLQPLGIVVFYGLASATLLTLFVIPCFYLLIHEFW
ncbi:MAG: AcrB/AcrD/AcrF family protein, partial [Cyanobacteria bacterium J083]